MAAKKKERDLNKEINRHYIATNRDVNKATKLLGAAIRHMDVVAELRTKQFQSFSREPNSPELEQDVLDTVVDYADSVRVGSVIESAIKLLEEVF